MCLEKSKHITYVTYITDTKCMFCIVSDRKQKWQYFLIDFCYFGNIALILYLWLVFLYEILINISPVFTVQSLELQKE